MRKALVAAALAASVVLGGCSVADSDVDNEDPYTELTQEHQAPTQTQAPTESADDAEEPAPAPVEEQEEADPIPEPPADSEFTYANAMSLLESLPVKGRAPKTGYDRSQFGKSWEDVDFNGCDTRNDILQRDMFQPSVESNGCIVSTGILHDPFSGDYIYFDRSDGQGGGVDIDHVVALSNAWQTGAQQISAEQRLAFANDPLNLLAVDAGLNRQKGDADAATWLPPNNAYRCEYVSRQIQVKSKYSLWVTPPEKDAMTRILSNCTTPWQATPPSEGAAPVPAPAPEPAPAAPEGGQDGLDPNFGTCKAAKAAGYGPYVKGQDPEYDYYRDGDGDGTVCE